MKSDQAVVPFQSLPSDVNAAWVRSGRIGRMNDRVFRVWLTMVQIFASRGGDCDDCEEVNNHSIHSDHRDAAMSFRALMSFLLAFPTLLADDSVADTTSVAKPAGTRQVLKNVELTRTGALNLQVVDNEGHALSDVRVDARAGGKCLSARSDASGRIRMRGIGRGTCLLRINSQQFACRTWRYGTAPPNSLTSIALVNSDASVVRGNRFRPGKGGAGDCCDECERTQAISSEAKYGLAITALAGTAAYFALSRDNVSD